MTDNRYQPPIFILVWICQFADVTRITDATKAAEAIISTDIYQS